MNRNITPIILIILSVGIYFTFTKGQIDKLKEEMAVNASYQTAIDNAKRLISVRDKMNKVYSSIGEDDKDRLNKLVPDNIDNVRLIIDVNNIALRHGFTLKGVQTTPLDGSKTSSSDRSVAGAVPSNNQYNTMALTFNVTGRYQDFLNFLRDLERSLRILDTTKITLTANESGTYDYGVELRTYWLKQ